MRNPQTIESRIVDYFQTAPTGEADLLWGIIRGVRAARRPPTAPKTKVTRRVRKSVNVTNVPTAPITTNGGIIGPE